MRRRRMPARVRVDGEALDVADLPSFGFSHRSLMWWGTVGPDGDRGHGRSRSPSSRTSTCAATPNRWPPSTPPPDLLWGTLNTVVLLASMWPNHLAKRAAERLDLRRRAALADASCLAVLARLPRRPLASSSTALNVRWDSDAYGSIVWMLLGLHTLHLITDTWDTAVLDVLLFTGPLEGKRFVDVSENALYWYFVVLELAADLRGHLLGAARMTRWNALRPTPP